MNDLDRMLEEVRERAYSAGVDSMMEHLNALEAQANRLRLMYEEVERFNRTYRNQPMWNEAQDLLGRIEGALKEMSGS